MPRCVKCQEFLPPNYTEVIPENELREPIDNIKEGEFPQQCIFCKLDIKEVEVEVSKDKTQKFSKAECIKEYIEFINKIKDKANKGTLLNQKNRGIIMP